MNVNNSSSLEPEAFFKTSSSQSESPDSITTPVLDDLEGSSSSHSLKQVPTDPTVKGVLKTGNSQAPAADEKSPLTNCPKASVSFETHSTANDGEKKLTKFAPITSNTQNKKASSSSKTSTRTPTPLRPRSTPPVPYLPDDYLPDPALEKAMNDAGRFIYKKLEEAASTVSDLIRRPEDFFMPDQKPKSNTSSKPPGIKSSSAEKK